MAICQARSCPQPTLCRDAWHTWFPKSAECWRGHRSDELYEKVSSAQKALQDAIREELQRL